MIRFGVFLFLLMSVALKTQAEVTLAETQKEDNGAKIVDVWGQIRPNDFRDLRKLLLTPATVTLVRLNSSGGDVKTALDIGNLLYSQTKPVDVQSKNCGGACVFIFASAPVRILEPGAEIEIHRPFDIDLNLTQAERDQLTQKTSVRAVTQFNRVGVAGELWDLMVLAPQDAGRDLREAELESVGLIGLNPKLDDYLSATDARDIKISTASQLKLKEAFETCVRKFHARYGRGDPNFESNIGNQCINQSGGL